MLHSKAGREDAPSTSERWDVTKDQDLLYAASFCFSTSATSFFPSNQTLSLATPGGQSCLQTQREAGQRLLCHHLSVSEMPKHNAVCDGKSLEAGHEMPGVLCSAPPSLGQPSLSLYSLTSVSRLQGVLGRPVISGVPAGSDGLRFSVGSQCIVKGSRVIYLGISAPLHCTLLSVQ